MDHMGHGLTPILVTGASGYLGSHILAMCRHRNLAAVGTGRRADVADDVDYPGYDLSDPGAMSSIIEATGAGTVIHCAAEVPKSDQDYADEDAQHGNEALVDELIAARPERIVFISSMTVYTAGDPTPVCEDAPCEPRTGYACAKRRAELRLKVGCARTSVLRLPGLFGGERRTGLVYNAVRAALGGGKLTPPMPAPLWAAMHVDDAAEAVLGIAVAPPVPYEVLNVGYPGPMNIGLFLKLVSEHIGGCIPRHDDGPVFEVQLDRLRARCGLPKHTFIDRLQAMAAELEGEVDVLS